MTPGVGKSARLCALGQRWGAHVEVVVGSIREPSDFLGMPVVGADGTTRFAPPAWASALAGAPSGLLFLDELSSAAPAVQKAMLRVLQERVVGDLRLPDSVAIVAAANPISTAVDGWFLAAPVANRLVHLEWETDLARWVEGSTVGFDRLGEPSLVDLLGERSEARRVAARTALLAFLRVRPDLAVKVPGSPERASLGWPSLRSWTNAAAALGELDPADEDAWLAVAKGAVGEEAASELLAWRVANDLYDPEAVLADPKIVDWTTRPDRIWALTGALAALGTTGGARRWAKALGALTACAEAKRPDLAIPAVRSLLEHRPEGADVPERTAEAFRELFVATGRWAA